MNEISEEKRNRLKEWGYVVTERIGKGAFSLVYQVQEKNTGNIYACKISDKWELLIGESKLLRQISHPVFPKFHEFQKCGEWAVLIMEYIPGKNLKELILQTGPLSEKQTLQIIWSLAEGLCYLHELPNDIVFRDVKSENIMIGENGRVTLIDLGSAGIPVGSRGIITGTPGYGAPEQWNNREKVGAHSDVYALGQVLTEMLAGRKTWNRHCDNGNYEELCLRERGVHWGIIRLIRDCTKTAVEERVPSMRSLLQRLKPYVQSKKRRLFWLEWKERILYKKGSEYIFQQNILKNN
uniref:serine/threonine protein kinase n=1 Tax=Acetatifactor sp. TaxID=1872090 RepID=UPI0040566B88